jgi:hypothetical protein
MSDPIRSAADWTDADPSSAEMPDDARPSPEEMVQRLLAELKEFWSHFQYYLSAKSDLARLFIHSLIERMVLFAIGSIAAASLLAVSGWFLLDGMAGGLGQLFQSEWLGQLVAGALMIGGVILFVHIARDRRRSEFMLKTRHKYERAQQAREESGPAS